MNDPDAQQHWRELSPRQLEHQLYLTSSEWRMKRKLVLERCRSVCEGCGTQIAVEVHHVTYRHWKREFLFELVGLCRACHQRLEGMP